jgi:hypothetical protein
MCYCYTTVVFCWRVIFILNDPLYTTRTLQPISAKLYNSET